MEKLKKKRIEERMIKIFKALYKNIVRTHNGDSTEFEIKSGLRQ